MSTDDCKDESKSTTDDDGSMKWMCSKMRVMRKMVISNSSGTDDNKPAARSAVNKFNDHRSEIKSNTSNNSTEIVRVCSDCNTTKTPLWRGGPQGPKSLCNACGIRRRKARRAMALAAAIENETEDMDSSTSNKMQNKEKKSRTSYVTQHKQHVNDIATSPHTTKKNLGFEDFAMSLISKNSPFRRVLPRDEQEAAILLMALSCGLIHS